jgi:hypothetical protein
VSLVIHSEPSPAFVTPGKEVLRITPEGRMIIGDGLSAEDATQQAARLLIKAFSEQIEAMIERRLAASKEGKP